MNRLSRFVLIVVAALALLAGAAAAQPPVGTVHVIVRAPGGGPIAGVRVTVESAADSRYAAAADTDTQGASTFADVPLGEVTVKVYDGQEQLLVNGKGLLEHTGDVITLILEPAP